MRIYFLILMFFILNCNHSGEPLPEYYGEYTVVTIFGDILENDPNDWCSADIETGCGIGNPENANYFPLPFGLGPAYPNPAYNNSSTVIIPICVPPGYTKLYIENEDGIKIRTLIDDTTSCSSTCFQNIGLNWNLMNDDSVLVEKGLYKCVLETEVLNCSGDIFVDLPE